MFVRGAIVFMQYAAFVMMPSFSLMFVVLAQPIQFNSFQLTAVAYWIFFHLIAKVNIYCRRDTQKHAVEIYIELTLQYTTSVLIESENINFRLSQSVCSHFTLLPVFMR